MPVIAALWEAEVGGSPGSGVQDQPDQHGKTSSLLKNTKISQAWWFLPAVPATRETEAGGLLKAEVSVSRDCATALLPGDRMWLFQIIIIIIIIIEETVNEGGPRCMGTHCTI